MARVPRGPLPGLGISSLHLVVLWSFAALQPVLDLIDGSPDVLVAEDVTGVALVIFAVVLAVAVPGVLVGAEALAGAVRSSVRYPLHIFFVGALVALWALQARVPLHLSLSTPPILAAALVLGALGGILYARAPVVRSFLTVLAPAPIVFVLVFLLASRSSDLLNPSEAEGRAVSPRPETPLIVMVFDEFPLVSLLDERRRVDPGRYPNFARLARRSTWFRNTATVDFFTPFAVPAILTGNRPKLGRAPTFNEQPRSLLSLFGGSRPRPVVIERVTGLCPPDVCRPSGSVGTRVASAYDALFPVIADRLLPPGVAGKLRSFARRTFGLGPDRAQQRRVGDLEPGREFVRALDERVGDIRRFTSSLDVLARERRPPVVFIHVLLPHGPWTYLPSGRQVPPNIPGQRKFAVWGPDQDAVDRSWRKHLLQLEFVDRLLGAILARLDRLGLADEVALVLTADHGATFRAGAQRRSAERRDLEETGLVPFFLTAPRQPRGRVVDKPVETVDVLPTLLDAADVRLPWRVDGRSALDPGFRGRPELRYTEGGQKERTVSRRWLSGERGALRRKLSLFGSGRPVADR